MTRSKVVCTVTLALAFVVGCSGSNSTATAGNGGQLSAGGTTAQSSTLPLMTVPSGGSPSAGASSSGAVSSSTGGLGTGGSSAVAAGGTAATGGSKASGGSKAAGGTSGSNGGTQASGGTSNATGGTKTTGGTSNAAAGGSAPTGGTPAAGGSTVTGGSAATGGTKASGGTNSPGGSKATGGAPNVGGSSANGGGSAHSGAWRVMPLGDSITGTTCYPQLLSKNLIAGGHANFTFVGTVTNNQSCGANAPNVKSEGHGGYLVTDLVGSGSHASELQTWVTSDSAEIVLMHFGTNDVWGNQRTTTQILNAYTTIVAALRAVNKNVVIFVAQIIPLNPSTCTTCDYPKELNAAIPAWAQGLSSTESPIYVVDLHSVFDPASIYVPNSSYTSDGVHPNQTGAQMMADKMYTDLVAKGYF